MSKGSSQTRKAEDVGGRRGAGASVAPMPKRPHQSGGVMQGRYQLTEDSPVVNYCYVPKEALDQPIEDLIPWIFTALKMEYVPELMFSLNLAEDVCKWNPRVAAERKARKGPQLESSKLCRENVPVSRRHGEKNRSNFVPKRSLIVECSGPSGPTKWKACYAVWVSQSIMELELEKGMDEVICGDAPFSFRINIDDLISTATAAPGVDLSLIVREAGPAESSTESFFAWATESVVASTPGPAAVLSPGPATALTPSTAAVSTPGPAAALTPSTAAASTTGSGRTTRNLTTSKRFSIKATPPGKGPVSYFFSSIAEDASNRDINYIALLLKKALSSRLALLLKLCNKVSSTVPRQQSAKGPKQTWTLEQVQDELKKECEESDNDDVHARANAVFLLVNRLDDVSAIAGERGGHRGRGYMRGFRIQSDQDYNDEDEKSERGGGGSSGGVGPGNDEELLHYQHVIKANCKRLLKGTSEACLQCKAIFLLEPAMIKNEVRDVVAEWVSESGAKIPAMLAVGQSERYYHANKLKENCWELDRDNPGGQTLLLVPPEEEILWFIEFDRETGELYSLQRRNDSGGGGSAGGTGWLPPCNASHLILCENESLLRSKIESHIPTGMLILNGGPETTRKFCTAVETGQPVFCFKYTGATADLVGYMVEEMEKSRVEELEKQKKNKGSGGSGSGLKKSIADSLALRPSSKPFQFANDLQSQWAHLKLGTKCYDSSKEQSPDGKCEGKCEVAILCDVNGRVGVRYFSGNGWTKPRSTDPSWVPAEQLEVLLETGARLIYCPQSKSGAGKGDQTYQGQQFDCEVVGSKASVYLPALAVLEREKGDNAGDDSTGQFSPQQPNPTISGKAQALEMEVEISYRNQNGETEWTKVAARKFKGRWRVTSKALLSYTSPKGRICLDATVTQKLNFVGQLLPSEYDSCRQLNVLASNWPDRFNQSSLLIIDMWDDTIESLQDSLTKSMSSISELNMDRGGEEKRLSYAWKLRQLFMHNAVLQKFYADTLNFFVIVLSLSTTIVAVIYTFVSSSPVSSSSGLFADAVGFSGFTSAKNQERAFSTILALNICLPLIITVLRGLIAAFEPQVKYHQLHMAAVKLESEIYMYRCKVGKYSNRKRENVSPGAGGSGGNRAASGANSKQQQQQQQAGGKGNSSRSRGQASNGHNHSADKKGGGHSLHIQQLLGGESESTADKLTKEFSSALEEIWNDLAFSDISKGALVFPEDLHQRNPLEDTNRRIENNRREQKFLSQTFANRIEEGTQGGVAPTADDQKRPIEGSGLYVEVKGSRRKEGGENQVSYELVSWHNLNRIVPLESVAQATRVTLQLIPCCDCFGIYSRLKAEVQAHASSQGIRFQGEKTVVFWLLLITQHAFNKMLWKLCCCFCPRPESKPEPDDFDDGVSSMTAEEYVRKRLWPIVAEYTVRAPVTSCRTSIVTGTTIFLSVLSSVMSTFGLVVWIPVALALASALSAWQSFQMWELRLTMTNGALHQLHQIMYVFTVFAVPPTLLGAPLTCPSPLLFSPLLALYESIWWDSCSLIRKRSQESKHILVTFTETIIQSSHVGFNIKAKKEETEEGGG